MCLPSELDLHIWLMRLSQSHNHVQEWDLAPIATTKCKCIIPLSIRVPKTRINGHVWLIISISRACI